jgi:Ca-activated chloride channel family protein
MNIDANDSKWTAYALGEITVEQERAELEAILKESPEMRQLVEEIRQAAGLLKMELQSEPAMHLTPDQKAKIEAKAGAGRTWFGLRPIWAMAGAATMIVLISFITLRQFNRPEIVPEQTQIVAAIPNEPATIQDHNIEVPVNADQNSKAIPVKPQIPKSPMVAAASQLTTQLAAVRGVVSDTSHAVLPGATVQAIDAATGVVKTTTTNNAGVYEFSSLPAGPYSIKAEMNGFQPHMVTDVALNAASARKIDINLPVAGVASEVMVSASAENMILEAASSTGTELKGQAANALPMASNNLVDSIGTVPGGVVSGYVSGMGWRANAPVAAPPPPPRPVRRQELWDRRYPPRQWPQKPDKFNTEAYDAIKDNPFLDVLQNPLSTFSIDVDTASYSNVRRFLDDGKLPPKDAVRIEELVNYFDYEYKSPKDGKPFAANFELTEAPWNSEHRLLRIGLKGREISEGKRPNSNLVFLLDVSGSMVDENKLPLVKEAMGLLVDRLTESDQVAIVIYASDTKLWMSSTSGDQKEKIRYAINGLHAGGSTNGGSGIQLAYQTAKESFIQGGVNRVILATDGDFNVGVTNQGDLTRLIEEKAKSGIYLSALGFGMGNYKDSTLETLAGKGHGNYAYIDNLNEAKKVFVEQINSTLVAIAKDVKIQVEFNPRHVSAYRLIGYEDRLMAKEDFNNDAKEAGVIGAGHAVTALYELVPAGISDSKPGVDPLKYQKPAQTSASADSNELVTVKIRSKEPEKDTSVLTDFAVKNSGGKFSNASQDFKFAAAVAAFGMVLRDSPYKGNANLESALEWAKEGKGIDKYGYRQEFIRLVHRAFSISY